MALPAFLSRLACTGLAMVVSALAAAAPMGEADARQVDLIVMGYHPRGRLEEAIVGSVSRSVLRRAKVPVLLVRLPERVDV
jgi:nucleotide-binding universal stress UspA family protein